MAVLTRSERVLNSPDRTLFSRASQTLGLTSADTTSFGPRFSFFFISFGYAFEVVCFVLALSSVWQLSVPFSNANASLLVHHEIQQP